MKTVFWILQFALGGMFVFAGLMKTFTPVEELAVQMPWVNDFSVFMVRFIGVAEFLGGLGLVLPSVLRIKPMLAPLAAVGLLLVMVIAAVYHLMKGEYSAIGVNFIFGALMAFVAWGRWYKFPVAARG